jgi:hypothetical protein
LKSALEAEPNLNRLRHSIDKVQVVEPEEQQRPFGDHLMKRLAIAIILIVAAPAVATASSSLMNELSGQSEVVAESSPSADQEMISAKSSRPHLQIKAEIPVAQPVDAGSKPDWL